MATVELKDLQYLLKQHMWSDKDIQNTLDYLNTHKTELDKFKNELNVCYSKFTDYCNDKGAILFSVDEGVVEAFRRFDSDVLEQYIDSFEKIILKGEHY